MSEVPCDRKGKWFGSCKFEPRYDNYVPSESLQKNLYRQWALSESDKDLLVERRLYVHDICVTCGRIVAPCLDQ